MKLKQWLFGAAALAMLGACSDNFSDGPTPDSSESRGSGYISIALGLPNNVGTRANDVFGDGVENEYKVTSLAILFFTGREDEAKFYKAYNVSPAAFTANGPDGDQITSIKRPTFEVSITETNETLWALAVVNYRSILSVSEDGKVNIVGGSEFTGSITDFMKLTTTANLSTAEQFFMTNTPYVTMPGSGNVAPTGFVHFLALVDKEKIMETEAEAERNPAAEIFVERAVAKVMVTTEDYGVNVNGSGISDIESIEWVLDNTEPVSYVARNLSTDFDATAAPTWMTYTTAVTNPQRPLYAYRFAGNTPFAGGLDMYRVYYGLDPNGAGIALNEEKLKVLKDAEIGPNTFKPIAANSENLNPQYCYENTFDVLHQDYHNTTRALLKVTFKGGDFYTRGIDRKTKYTFNDAAATLAHFVLEDPDVVAAWTDSFEEATTITMADLVYSNASKTAENKWFKVNYRIVDGRLLVTDFTLYDGTADKNEISLKPREDKTVAQVKTEAIANINSMATFNAYVGGVSYYGVRIKHFGDDLTPWDAPKNDDGSLMATPDTDISYGITRDGESASLNNYLGRYGVLRNNWYELNISEISKYGEPQIKDLPLDGTPDDNNEPEQAIACKVNILSWAKRTQDVDL